MASRSFLVAALALCALLAGAAAAKPVPPPITNPCAGNMSALSASLTNATNTQLAKTYGQSNTTTTEKPVKFTVPKVCGPLGTCAGGNTYQATAGKTKTIQGARQGPRQPHAAPRSARTRACPLPWHPAPAPCRPPVARSWANPAAPSCRAPATGPASPRARRRAPGSAAPSPLPPCPLPSRRRA